MSISNESIYMIENEWKVNGPGLLEEIASCAIPKSMGVLKFPLNIFKSLLYQVAERAIELDDYELNVLMIRLALYDNCLPSDVGYDKVVEYINRER
jgi:hypothetical protein